MKKVSAAFRPQRHAPTTDHTQFNAYSSEFRLILTAKVSKRGAKHEQKVM